MARVDCLRCVMVVTAEFSQCVPGSAEADTPGSRIGNHEAKKLICLYHLASAYEAYATSRKSLNCAPNACHQ